MVFDVRNIFSVLATPFPENTEDGNVAWKMYDMKYILYKGALKRKEALLFLPYLMIGMENDFICIKK